MQGFVYSEQLHAASLRLLGHTMNKIKLTEYMKTAEAADYLGVSQNTLRKWAALGSIPMQRNPVNGYRLFRRKDLDSFLQNIAKSVSPKKPR